jgi:hypothetical protein
LALDAINDVIWVREHNVGKSPVMLGEVTGEPKGSHWRWKMPLRDQRAGM